MRYLPRRSRARRVLPIGNHEDAKRGPECATHRRRAVPPALQELKRLADRVVERRLALCVHPGHDFAEILVERRQRT